MMPRLVAGALLLAVSFPALAGQVGQLRTLSTLGQPLEARVELYGFSAAEAASAGIALKADIAASRAERAALAGIAVSTANYADGSPYLRLSSAQPITEPVVRFRLRLVTETQTRIAHFALAPDPAPVAPARVDQRRRAAAMPAAAVPTGPAQQYGPVRPGQTLWRILRELGLSGAGQQALIASIVAASPDAFVNGDADRLKIGATLNIPARPVAGTGTAAETVPAVRPTAAAAATTSAATVATPVPEALVAQTPRAETRSTEPAPADTPVSAQAPSASTPAASAIAPAAARTPALPADIAARQARLDALALKFAAIRVRYEQQVSSADTPATAATPAKSTTAAKPATPPVVDTAPSVSPATAKPQTAAMAPGAASFSSTILLWAAAIVSLLAILGAATLAWQRWRQRRHQQISEADDERTLAEIARKTEDRLRLETELRQRRAGQAPEPDADDSSIERSVMAEEESALNEIEHRIAHGQYSEAQSMLETVIAQTPHNYRAKLRLAEIHYLSERAEAFVELATDLYENHRADIGDDGWARVVRMGKVLAPERPPFSGPVEVAGEN